MTVLEKKLEDIYEPHGENMYNVCFFMVFLKSLCLSRLHLFDKVKTVRL